MTGIAEYRITFLNECGDITHSEHGFVFYTLEGDADTMSDAQRELVKEYITAKWVREGNHTYGYRITLVECAEDEEE